MSPQHIPLVYGALRSWGSYWLILPVNCFWSSPSSWHPGPWGACPVDGWQLKILVCGFWAPEDYLPQSKTVTTYTGKNSYTEASWDGNPMLFWGYVHTLFPCVTARNCPTCMEGSVYWVLSQGTTVGVVCMMHRPYPEGNPFCSPVGRARQGAGGFESTVILFTRNAELWNHCGDQHTTTEQSNYVSIPDEWTWKCFFWPFSNAILYHCQNA